MPKNRFYFNSPLKKNTSIKIDTKEVLHIQKIMRKKQGDIIEIINGQGFLASSEIVKIDKKFIEVKINKIIFEEEKKPKIFLLQPFLKFPNIELVLEKCTELGCSEFWFFESENSEKPKISKNKLDRFNTILTSAIKQCGSLYLPKIKFFDSLEGIKNKLLKNGNIKNIQGNKTLKKNLESRNIFFGYRFTSNSLLDIYCKNKQNIKDTNIYFIIGPEKGFTKNENLFLENSLKALPINLNSNTLRAETASIAASCIISHIRNV